MCRHPFVYDKYTQKDTEVNYIKIYKQLMDKSRQEGRCKKQGVYYEQHHILPNFLFKDRKDRQGQKGHLDGDPNNKDNLILLTAREHFIAHLLLTKIYKGTRYDASAKKSLVWFFTVLDKPDHPRKDWFLLSQSRKYQQYRKLAVDGIRQQMKGKMLVKDALTGEKIGRVSTNHEKVLSGDWVHFTKGRVPSAQERHIWSIQRQGMNNSNAKPLITKEVILNDLLYYIHQHNKYGNNILKKEIIEHLGESLNISSTIIKNRFGSFVQLIVEINKSLQQRNLDNIIYDPYFRSEENRNRFSKEYAEYRWFTDGNNNSKVKLTDIQHFINNNPTYYKGRTIC